MLFKHPAANWVSILTTRILKMVARVFCPWWQHTFFALFFRFFTSFIHPSILTTRVVDESWWELWQKSSVGIRFLLILSACLVATGYFPTITLSDGTAMRMANFLCLSVVAVGSLAALLRSGVLMQTASTMEKKRLHFRDSTPFGRVPPGVIRPHR